MWPRERAFNFTHWYNREHRHSGIKFVTPYERHTGQDIEILNTNEKAKQKNPMRWSSATRNWVPVNQVYLNPEKQNDDLENIV